MKYAKSSYTDLQKAVKPSIRQIKPAELRRHLVTQIVEEHNIGRTSKLDNTTVGTLTATLTFYNTFNKNSNKTSKCGSNVNKIT